MDRKPVISLHEYAEIARGNSLRETLDLYLKHYGPYALPLNLWDLLREIAWAWDILEDRT